MDSGKIASVLFPIATTVKESIRMYDKVIALAAFFCLGLASLV